ncbi:MAG: MFS transporter [Lacisediminihabitans sp.]
MKFAALRAPWYKGYLVGGSFLMAGDNAEHAITYWAMWQYFHSPLLAGFAVISHWLPHLLGGIAFGALADRYDCRRIIQVGCALFMFVSVCWGVLLLTGTLQPWHCLVLLLVHGLASAVWRQADGVMIFDLVGRDVVPSGVRLMSTGLSLGQFVGPAFGAAMLFAVGAPIGMFINVALYLPFLIYLFIVPVDGHRHQDQPSRRVSFSTVLGVLKDLPKYPSILVVMVLQGAAGLLIGTALMPLFPEFGALLGQEDSGLGYGALIVAMSFGAVVGGISLEAIGRVRASTRLAIISTLVMACAYVTFALSRNYPLSLGVLVIAGLASLVSDSTSQTVVQLAAPNDRRGSFIGAYAMTSMGFRVGSGIVIGVLGGLLGVSGAIALAGSILVIVAVSLLLVVLTTLRRQRTRIEPDVDVPLDGAVGEVAAD